MTINKRIGLVGGGQMGEALIRGMIESGLVTGSQLMVAEPDSDRRTYMKGKFFVNGTDSATELCRHSEVIIMAIKPQVMEPVLGQYGSLLSGKLLISIAAGVTIAAMEKIVGKIRLIRVMPNTPALVLAGASALSANSMATDEDVQLGMDIFSAIGTCVSIDEHLLDAVTGLSGSGPGFVFTFIDGMIDGGVLAGLPRPIAKQLVLQTVYGSAKLALESGDEPGVLKSMVTSPGGTTIAGIHELEKGGLRATVMSAVKQAAKRSAELGQEP
jgi:pyrroline-5-carboxylate reductase